MRWWRQSAEQGYALAQCIIGFAYDGDPATDEDKTEAIKWWRKAAAQGDEDARMKLDELGVSY